MIRKSMPLGLDPRVVTGFPKRSCSNKKIERDDDSRKSHPALGQRKLDAVLSKDGFSSPQTAAASSRLVRSDRFMTKANAHKRVGAHVMLRLWECICP